MTEPAAVSPAALADTVRTWVRAWTVSRELDPPLAHGSGWRVEVGLPEQRRRHVFPALGDELRALGADVHEPWCFLKCLATVDALRTALPVRWRVQPQSAMMVFEGDPPTAPALPAGYALAVPADAQVPHVRVLAADGGLAADGRVVMLGDEAIIDRIGTDAAHRRRGLGTAVMCALHAIARERGARRGLLVATQQGRALYETLGWRTIAPYASAVVAAEA